MTPPSARPLRILHLLPDLAIGGGQAVVLNHVRGADRRTVDVQVVALGEPSDMAPAFRAAGIEPRSLGHEPGHRMRTLLRLLHLVRVQRPDILHLHSGNDRVYGELVAAATRTPVVYHLHGRFVHLGPATGDEVLGVPPRRHDRLQRAVFDRIEPRVVRHYAATSDDVAALFEPLVTAPVTVVPQAMPLDDFDAGRTRRVATRKDLGLAPEEVCLVSVGRLVAGKGQIDLVRMLARLDADRTRTCLVLVGDGERRGALEEEAERLGVRDRVHLLGVRHDVADLLGAADLFVFASRSEGFGLVVLEALAAGLPVVAQRLPTLAAMVDDTTGRLVDPGDVAAMAAEVDALVADPAMRAQLGTTARARVADRHPPDATARVLEGIYRQVLRPGEVAR